MSAAETEEEAPPPQKKSIFACLTNLPGVCVPQKSDDPGANEPTPKSKSPTSVASKFAALSPYNRKRKQEEQAAKEHEARPREPKPKLGGALVPVLPVS